MNDIKPKFYELLKDKRKTKQISLKEMSEYTKINIGYLESLENGEFDVLPTVYTRLFLRSYCEYIGIDSKEILDEYQIYTVGNKKQDNFSSLDETSAQLDKDSDLKIEKNRSITTPKKIKDIKEILIAIGVIITIIIIFVIISSAN